MQKILQQFKMNEANQATMPYGHSSGGTDDSVGCHVPYHEAVDCLMYLMTATCPHIAFSMSPAAQAMDQPTEAEWIDVEHILKYL
jgi:hypothetical protein